jgi:hypothetical protein
MPVRKTIAEKEGVYFPSPQCLFLIAYVRRQGHCEEKSVTRNAANSGLGVTGRTNKFSASVILSIFNSWAGQTDFDFPRNAKP